MMSVYFQIKHYVRPVHDYVMSVWMLLQQVLLFVWVCQTVKEGRFTFIYTHLHYTLGKNGNLRCDSWLKIAWINKFEQVYHWIDGARSNSTQSQINFQILDNVLFHWQFYHRQDQTHSILAAIVAIQANMSLSDLRLFASAPSET